MSDSELPSYISFTLGDNTYALDISRIHEITRFAEFNRIAIPDSPDHILGTANIRGRTVTVMDLHLLFNQQPLTTTANTVIMVIEATAKNIGVMTNHFAALTRSPTMTLTAAATKDADSPFLEGVFDDGIRVINIDTLAES